MKMKDELASKVSVFEVEGSEESQCFECGEPADKIMLGTPFCDRCAEVVQKELGEEDERRWRD